MKLVQVDANHFTITAENFSVQINMNARDAMVFVEVECTETDKEKQTILLRGLHTLLKGQFGGKIIIALPTNLQLIAEEAGLGQNTQKLMVLPVTTVRARMEKPAGDAKAILDKVKAQTGYKLERIIGREPESFFEKLFAFKRDNASFVNPDKIKQGIYSPLAERVKSQLPSVLHFVLKRDDEIVATCMFALNHSGKMAYAGDLIVNKSLQNKQLAQLLLAEIHKALASSPVDNICFIEGGDADGRLGKHLYEEILGAAPAVQSAGQKPDNKASNKEKATVFLAMFGPPRLELLRAANRDPKHPHNSLDQPLQAPSALFSGGSREAKAPASTPKKPTDQPPGQPESGSSLPGWGNTTTGDGSS